jgi:hypothetical protein
MKNEGTYYSMIKVWHVTKTPMWPNQWFVTSSKYRQNNSPCRYFTRKNDADRLALDLNLREESISEHTTRPASRGIK